MSFDPKRGRLRAGASVCALTLFLVPGAPASADEVVPPALPQVVPELSSDTCVSASEEVIDQEVWTENALGLPYARTTSSGEGTNVAVLGSGVDDTPAALAGAVAEGGEDCTGFGTFLAGVVAARPQSDSGLVGVAPEARVTAVPVTDERGRSDADALAEGMTEAVSEGADVVLVGVALPIGSSDLDAAVDTAEAENVLVSSPPRRPVSRARCTPPLPPPDPRFWGWWPTAPTVRCTARRLRRTGGTSLRPISRPRGKPF